jgi:hypothetical protein
LISLDAGGTGPAPNVHYPKIVKEGLTVAIKPQCRFADAIALPLVAGTVQGQHARSQL